MEAIDDREGSYIGLPLYISSYAPVFEIPNLPEAKACQLLIIRSTRDSLYKKREPI